MYVCIMVHREPDVNKVISRDFKKRKRHNQIEKRKRIKRIREIKDTARRGGGDIGFV